ncbi:MAG: hypothetical protein BBJ60_10375 [Desulfobacterales bacterium S7086C20]|nr:MAG: hypothetical protein BBJ60_10375 [Desulfobacterales bacterium S7086C20]
MEAFLKGNKKSQPELLTTRQQIVVLLSRGRYRAKEVSQELSIREKEVYDHLDHIARTVARQKQRLLIEPSRCLSCGYVFNKRKRFAKPGRCPSCRSEHIREPMYYITKLKI